MNKYEMPHPERNWLRIKDKQRRSIIDSALLLTNPTETTSSSINSQPDTIMRSFRYTLTLALVSLVALLPRVPAETFEDISTHLDTDGTFFGFIDFAGDGHELGQALNSIYSELVVHQPMLAFVQMDFHRLFETLGFSSLQAIGVSSKPLADGIHANRFALSLQNGEPEGLLRIYGDPSKAIATFTAAELAPADATGAYTGNLQLDALKDVVVTLMTQFMGPVGEILANAKLEETLPGTNLRYSALIDTLSGKWHIFWQEEMDDTFNSTIKVWLRIEGAATLADRLKPLADAMQFVYHQTENGVQADLSSLLPLPGYGLYMETSNEPDSFTLYTHADWGPDSPGPRLSETDDFRRLAQYLPTDALNFTYTSAFDIHSLLQAIRLNSPELGPYLPAMEKTLDLFIGDFLKPAISATCYEKDVLITHNYAAYSIKQATMLLPAAFLGGLTAAAAIPMLESMDSVLPKATGVEETPTDADAENPAN